MRDKNTLKIINLVFAAVSIIVCLLLCGQIIGFDQGLGILNFPRKENSPEIRFAHSSGPQAYEVFGGGYALAAICFAIYIIARLKQSGTLSKFIPILPLSVVIFLFWKFIRHKNDYLRENDVLAYYKWIVSSVPFDWFCLLAAIILMLIQVAIIIQNYTDKSINDDLS